MLIKGHRVGGLRQRGHLVGFGGVPITPVVQRYFTENLAAGGMYSAMSSSVPILGDFELEFDFYRSSPTGGSFIFSNYDTVAGKYGLSIYSTGDYGAGAGTLKVFGGTSPLISGLSNNKYYKVAFKYVSATGKMTTYLNGAIYSGPVNSTLPSGMGTSDVSAIARAAQGSFYFAGIVANLKLWLSANRDPSSLRIDMPLDEPGTEPVFKNNATMLGSNLWVNPVLNGWVDNTDGSYTLVGDGSFQNLLIPTPTAGTAYLLSFEVVSVDGSMKIQSSGNIFGFSSAKKYELALTATANLIGFARNSGAVNCTIKNIIIKEIPAATPYAARINQSVDDTELYSQIDIGWLGQNFLRNGSFDVDLSWNKSGNWTIANGHAVSDGSVWGLLYQAAPRSSKYRISVDILSTNNGVRFYNGAAYTSPFGVGHHVFDVENANQGYAYFSMKTDSGVTAVMDNVSANRLLEMA
ncbi:hypothetical protein [Neptunomonas japonica]|uniref:hypothetical protein n=1 Tax=Neptunomonas japonica TaxID=417574 RepID=UPI0003FB023F|nr:hypothetical protein [Neptunomonas japonica]